MNRIGTYQNGNFTVTIYDDGTKIRYTDGDSFTPAFPESMDIKITNRCDMGCPFCHEDSKSDGKHGAIMSLKFIDSLRPYTEMAIGGGNPLSHPDLLPFLEKLKALHIVPSMTVNQKHFMESLDFLKSLRDRQLIYGLGVSYRGEDDETPDFLMAVKQFPNAVIHIINGVATPNDILSLADEGLKVLILGYKDFRRGVKNRDRNGAKIAANQAYLYDGLPYMIDEQWFKSISFDNLAIKQLNARRLMDEKEWEQFYMGDDGSYTMYVDAVKEQFAVSSVSEKRHALLDNIDDMFTVVKEDATECATLLV